MPAKVYSTRFINASGANGTFSCPVFGGTRAVVKFIGGSWADGASSIVLYVAQNAVYYRPLPDSTGPFQAEVRYVAMGGESIVLMTYGPNVRCQVTGYLFDDTGARAEQLPGPEPPAETWRPDEPLGPIG